MKELIMLFSALLLLAIFRIVNGYLLFAIAIAVVAVSYYQYTKCAYYLITKNSPLQLYFDKGKLGEYMTYKRLKNMEREGAKFLFNLYIPKGEDETTEIDVLMLHPKGMFVFESKNYSGWILAASTKEIGTKHCRKVEERVTRKSFTTRSCKIGRTSST